MAKALKPAYRAALDVAIEDLDAAAAPTKSEVFTACGGHAADLREAIKAALAIIDQGVRPPVADAGSVRDISSLIAARCSALPGALIDCPVCGAVDKERARLAVAESVLRIRAEVIDCLREENAGLRRQRDELHETTNRYLARARAAEARSVGEAGPVWISLNVNEYVRVKLTERGLAILGRRHDQFNERLPSVGAFVPPVTDAEGWAPLQLWTLMRDFGPDLSQALPVPFETTIQIKAASPAVEGWKPDREAVARALYEASPITENMPARDDNWRVLPWAEVKADHPDRALRAYREAESVLALPPIAAAPKAEEA